MLLMFLIFLPKCCNSTHAACHLAYVNTDSFGCYCTILSKCQAEKNGIQYSPGGMSRELWFDVEALIIWSQTGIFQQCTQIARKRSFFPCGRVYITRLPLAGAILHRKCWVHSFSMGGGRNTPMWMWACASLRTSSCFKYGTMSPWPAQKTGEDHPGHFPESLSPQLSSKVSCEHRGVYEFDTECMY